MMANTVGRLKHFSLILGLLAPRAFGSAPVSLERNLSLMGTYVHVAVNAPSRERALQASDQIIKELESAETELSTWKSDSPLSQINALKVGSTYKLSPGLAADLTEALHCQQSTDGLFNPQLGKLIATWRLRDPKPVSEPSPAEIAQVLRPRHESSFAIDSGEVTRRAVGGDWEEGGFGKGAALDRALRAVAAGDIHVVVNLGGQLAVSSGPPAPAVLGGQALMIDRGSISTSGHDHRPGHILDPTTGRPTRDFGQLAVWADSALRADCLSTGLYVMGPRRAFEWSLQHPETRLVVQSGGEVYASCVLKTKIENQKTIRFVCHSKDIASYFKESK